MSHESEPLTSGSYVKCGERWLHMVTPNIKMEHSLEQRGTNKDNITQDTDNVCSEFGGSGRRFKNVHSFKLILLDNKWSWSTMLAPSPLIALDSWEYSSLKQQY